MMKNEYILELASKFRKQGFLILESFFENELIETLNNYFQKEYKDYFNKTENRFSTNLTDGRYNITIDIAGPFNNSNLYANPIIIDLLNQLFLDKYLIGDVACVTSLPGSTAQPVHRDSVIFKGSPLSKLLPPHAIGLLVPLISFNKVNGGTRIWPGTHIKDVSNDDILNDPNFFDANLDIGSVILLDHRVVHSGNANNSNDIRPLLYINYSPIWYFDQKIYKNQTPLKIDDENFELVSSEYKSLFIRRNIYK